MSNELTLDLADGQRWVIRPVDEEAAVILAELGRTMRLGRSCRSCTPGRAGRELWFAVNVESAESDRLGDEVGGPVVCRLAGAKQDALASLTDREMLATQMRQVAWTVAQESLVGGGLLLHAALAEYRGSGFIMAGPSGVGKSTAGRRLPLPWHMLCEDTTLVVRDGRGRFWAHPWPTWSLFYGDGPGGSWDVEHAVPLRAMFFLVQSPSEQLEPVNATQAAALVMQSSVNLAQKARRLLDEDTARVFLGEAGRAAKALAASVPAFSLRLSLKGRFWEEIERVLPVGALPGSDEDSRDRAPVSVESTMAPDSLRVVYTGHSMNPTLQQPDFLEVKPYGTGRVRPGDVVCFKSPGTGKMVVHRVVSVRGRGTADGGPAGGIRTRGDNNPTDDPWVIQAADIIGRVNATRRGARHRAIAGGWRGFVGLGCARLGRKIRRSAGLVPHKLYCFAAGLGPFDYLLPRALRPRLVRFVVRYRHLILLKLLMGRRTVGQYDGRQWRIQRPFHLFVDEQTLRQAVAFPDSGKEVRD